MYFYAPNYMNTFTKPRSKHTKAILLALLVTVLWSSSWVILKFGLKTIPPLIFAGSRYLLASLVLLVYIVVSGKFRLIKDIRKRDFYYILLLGLFFYTVTQGAQILALSIMPAVIVSLFFNFSPLFVMIGGYYLLAEKPTGRQWAGVFVFLAGMIAFFMPVKGEVVVEGVIILFLGVFANAFAALLGRRVNRAGIYDPILVTSLSMLCGSLILFAAGITSDGMPVFNFTEWSMIIWLAVVNTAFAFSVWNYTLRHLSASESSIINNTMLIQIALLAVIFLGESLSIKDILALLVVTGGVLMVTYRTGK